MGAITSTAGERFTQSDSTVRAIDGERAFVGGINYSVDHPADGAPEAKAASPVIAFAARIAFNENFRWKKTMTRRRTFIHAALGLA
ncbi:MAG: hypothetical protein M3Y67_11150, partial [Pseudomonadota bacterium]|nr:hypothetical protein [Pseudomonadota bacterium]